MEEDSRLTALFLWTMQSTAEGASSGNGVEPDDDENDEVEEDETPRRKAPGFSLPFDVARRFAQPLGIHLEDWESRIIKMEKGVVRLLPVSERGKQLFGESGAAAVADEMESAANTSPQLSLFPEEAPMVRGRARRRGRPAATAGGDMEAAYSATTLDRVHAAMLLQASGRSQALRNLLRAEQQQRSPDFLRLANAPHRPLSPGERRKTSTRRYAAGRAALAESPEIRKERHMTADPELLNRITARADIFHGKPIIRDMRIAVEHVLGMLASGDTAETILREYPVLEAEDIQACLLFAHRPVAGEQVHERMAVQ